jgi:hypothetical protein
MQKHEKIEKVTNSRDDKKERVVVRRGRLLKEKAFPGPNNRPVLWQRSSPYNNPFLFVIPSEAEGSAVPRTLPGNVFFSVLPAALSVVMVC